VQLLDSNFLLGAILVPAAYGCLRLIMATLMKGPANYFLGKSLPIRIGAWCWPFKHPNYSGRWEMIWYTDSENYPSSNKSTVTLHKFLKSITAEIESTPKTGTSARYRWVGKIHNNIVTGEWFDGAVNREGYYGAFQVNIDPTGQNGEGQWVGFSRTRVVRSGKLTWRKVLEQSTPAKVPSVRSGRR
jgi:hypothetical protein